MTASCTVRVLCALWIATMGAAASAQSTVYRCGPDGREYSNLPCADGRPVDVGDARSAEQRRQAQNAAQRDQRLAQQLANERRRREAAITRRGAARLDAPASAAAAGASAPAARKGKKKAVDAYAGAPPARGASAPR